MESKSTIQKIAIHIAGCTGFLLLPFISSPRMSIFDTLTFGPPEIKGLISSVLLILFFYASYYYLIPELFQKKKFFRWGVFSLLFLILVLAVPFYIVDKIPHSFPQNMPKEFLHDLGDSHINPYYPRPEPLSKNHFTRKQVFFRDIQFQESLLKFVVVAVFAFLLRINEMWKKAREEKRHAELSYLKLQVNPHFLFNTLNGIYALSLENSQKTPDAIVKLSELMRYVTTEINNDFVSLSKEIQYIRNYIDLQKIRLGDTVEVNLEIRNLLDDFLIAPLIMIPFVENAFKHGVDNSGHSVIDINIDIEDTTMIFCVKNAKSNQNSINQNGGTGLKNLGRRLELMYQGRHELKIKETDKTYQIELKLILKK